MVSIQKLAKAAVSGQVFELSTLATYEKNLKKLSRVSTEGGKFYTADMI